MLRWKASVTRKKKRKDPAIRKARTNLVQQAFNPIRRTTLHDIAQVLQQVLIVLHFLGKLVDLPRDLLPQVSTTLNPRPCRIQKRVPLSSLLPSNRIQTSHPEFTTLATNRGVATAFRLALPARLASTRHPAIIARCGARPLTRNSDLCGAIDTFPIRPRTGIMFRGDNRRTVVCDRDRLRGWQTGQRFLSRESFTLHGLGRHCRPSGIVSRGESFLMRESRIRWRASITTGREQPGRPQTDSSSGSGSPAGSRSCAAEEIEVRNAIRAHV